VGAARRGAAVSDTSAPAGGPAAGAGLEFGPGPRPVTRRGPAGPGPCRVPDGCPWARPSSPSGAPRPTSAETCRTAAGTTPSHRPHAVHRAAGAGAGRDRDDHGGASRRDAPGRTPPLRHSAHPAGPAGRGRADADEGLHRPVARAARGAGPGTCAARGHRARSAHLDAASGDGVAGPAGGDDRPVAPVPPPSADPFRLRPARGPTSPRCAAARSRACPERSSPGAPRGARAVLLAGPRDACPRATGYPAARVVRGRAPGRPGSPVPGAAGRPQRRDGRSPWGRDGRSRGRDPRALLGGVRRRG
jgi:hypothetical protein